MGQSKAETEEGQKIQRGNARWQTEEGQTIQRGNQKP